jgi:hypothetical protein
VALVDDAVQIAETWGSSVEERRLEAEKRVGASHSNLEDNLAEPWGRKERDTGRAEAEILDNRVPEDVKRGRKRHTDTQGSIGKVCTVLHPLVEDSQVHLATVDRRLQMEEADNSPGHLPPWEAQEDNNYKHPEGACRSIVLQDRH